MAKAYKCPNCGSEDVDGEYDPDHLLPKLVAGDYLICFECSAWLELKKVKGRKRKLEPVLIQGSEVLNKI